MRHPGVPSFPRRGGELLAVEGPTPKRDRLFLGSYERLAKFLMRLSHGFAEQRLNIVGNFPKWGDPNMDPKIA